LPDESFDLVTMWHVLEHVPYPRKTLAVCGRLLAANGRIVIAIPNLHGWEARLLGRNWAWLELPRHLHFFSPDNVRRLLEESGFKVEKVRPQLCPASAAQSLDLMLARMLGREFHPNISSARMINKVIFGPVVLSYLLGNIGNIEAHARKL